MAKNTIALIGHPIVTEDKAASAAVFPGHLVDGAGTSVAKNAHNAVEVPRTFALEREETGDGIEVAYASGERVKVGHFMTGHRVYAIIPSGENITAGDFLEANNAGELVTLNSGEALAVAVETVDNSAGVPGASYSIGSNAARLAVEIL